MFSKSSIFRWEKHKFIIDGRGKDTFSIFSTYLICTFSSLKPAVFKHIMLHNGHVIRILGLTFSLNPRLFLLFYGIVTTTWKLPKEERWTSENSQTQMEVCLQLVSLQERWTQRVERSIAVETVGGRTGSGYGGLFEWREGLWISSSVGQGAKGGSLGCLSEQASSSVPHVYWSLWKMATAFVKCIYNESVHQSLSNRRRVGMVDTCYIVRVKKGCFANDIRMVFKLVLVVRMCGKGDRVVLLTDLRSVTV